MGVICSKPGGGTSQYLRTFFFFSWRGERLGRGEGRAGQDDLSLTKGGPVSTPGSPQLPTRSAALSRRERIWVRAAPRPGGGCWFQGKWNLFPSAWAEAGQGQGTRGQGGGAKGVDIRVEGAGREAHINPPCSSLAPLVKGLLGGGRERYGEG